MPFASRHFVVVTEFTLKPCELDAFLALTHAIASASLADEPGCFAFDVLVTDSESMYVLLHEIYRDREAFDLHLKTLRYASFETSIEPLLDGDPRVRFLTTSVPG